MKLLSSISSPTEPVLEKWARLFRYTKGDSLVAKIIQGKKEVTILDLGCGQDTQYYHYLIKTFPELKNRLRYIGVDPLIKPRKTKNTEIIASKFETIKLNQKADIVCLFAVLEHVDDAGELIRKALSLTKSDGVVIATTPTPLAQIPLEFFSAVLNIISKREIDEHQRYPTRRSLLAIKLPRGASVHHEYFEFGLNNYFVVSRDPEIIKQLVRDASDWELLASVRRKLKT